MTPSVLVIELSGPRIRVLRGEGHALHVATQAGGCRILLDADLWALPKPVLTGLLGEYVDALRDTHAERRARP